MYGIQYFTFYCSVAQMLVDLSFFGWMVAGSDEV